MSRRQLTWTDAEEEGEVEVVVVSVVVADQGEVEHRLLPKSRMSVEAL
jgi:hypothetical protein